MGKPFVSVNCNDPFGLKHLSIIFTRTSLPVLLSSVLRRFQRGRVLSAAYITSISELRQDDLSRCGGRQSRLKGTYSPHPSAATPPPQFRWGWMTGLLRGFPASLQAGLSSHPRHCARRGPVIQCSANTASVCAGRRPYEPCIRSLYCRR